MKEFIVPLYGHNNEYQDKVLIGSGFIVTPNIFITAGHVIEEGKAFNTIGFVYNGAFLILTDPAYSIFKRIQSQQTIYHDLSIFYTDAQFPNALTLNTQQFYRNEKFSFLGYGSFNETTDENHDIREVTISISEYAYMKPSHSQSVVVHNCFGIFDFLNKGDSGAPIFDDYGVIGMVLCGLTMDASNKFGDPHGTIVMKSEYIQSVLNSLG